MIADRMRSITLDLFSCLTADADKLFALADTAMAWREATEEFEEGGAVPRRSMTAATYAGVGSILGDLALDVADSAEYRAALGRSNAESRRIGNIQIGKQRARAAENRRARELGHCPRCINGYIPGARQDGGVCYRCGGSGR